MLEPGAVTNPESSALATDCKTGAGRQRPRRLPDPRLRQQHPGVLDLGVLDVRATRIEPVDTVLFTGATSSGCGTASAATGPFYCPRDKLVYLDLDFFKELRDRFGAQGGSLAQGYVLAHEYGHHVQDLLGSLSDERRRSRRDRPLGPDGAPGRLLRRASGPTTPRAPAISKPITDAQIADALDAAAAVGDDRIQEATQGQVDPDSWTHGSSAQRQHWFTTGFQGGDPSGCDTSGGL